jgi:hypothetical protein
MSDKFVFHSGLYEENSSGQIKKLINSATASAVSTTGSPVASVTVTEDGVAEFSFGLPIGPTGPSTNAYGTCTPPEVVNILAPTTLAVTTVNTGFEIIDGSRLTILFSRTVVVGTALSFVINGDTDHTYNVLLDDASTQIPSSYIKKDETVTFIFSSSASAWLLIDSGEYGSLNGY